MSKKSKDKKATAKKRIEIEDVKESESVVNQDAQAEQSVQEALTNTVADDTIDATEVAEVTEEEYVCNESSDGNPATEQDAETEDADASDDSICDEGDTRQASRKAGITSSIRDWAWHNVPGIGDASLEQLDRILDTIDILTEESKGVIATTVDAVTEAVSSIKADAGSDAGDEGPEMTSDSDEHGEGTTLEQSDDAYEEEGDEPRSFADAIFGAFPPYFSKKRYGRVDADILQGDEEPLPDGDSDDSIAEDDDGCLEPWPIMPMSNILTERAAQRVREHSADSCDDPLSKSIRAERKIHETLNGIAPDFVTKGLSRASFKAIFGASRISDMLTDMQDVQRNGRTSADITTLGVRFLKRLAGMLREVSEATNDGELGDATESLWRAITWYEDGYYETASLLGHDAAREASMRVRREFDATWQWLGDNVFTSDPARRAITSHCEFWDKDQELPRTSDGIIDFGGLMGDVGNAVSGNPTSSDLHALPHAELERLAELLNEFSEVTQSWPEVYGIRPILADASDDWEDRQYWNLLGGVLRGDRNDTMEPVTSTDDDGNEQVFYRIKTNRQVGLSFAAWTQDCHEASRAIGFWGRQNAKDPTAITLMDIMTDDEKASVMERRMTAWKWLGDYIFMMSC